MKTELEGRDLMNWRRDRKLTQAELGELLGKTRNTVVRWENGTVRIPDNVQAKLAELAFTLAPKPVIPPPQWVTAGSAPHLYVKGIGAGTWQGIDIHPRLLCRHKFLDLPELDWSDQMKPPKIPYAILEDPRYLEAVERWRASGQVYDPPQ